MKESGLVKRSLAIFALAAGATLAAAGADRPDEEALRAISLQGRRIASYHEAVARAQARYREQNGDSGPVQVVIVDRGGVTKAVFVRRQMDAQKLKSAYVMVAEAGFNPRAGEVTTYQEFNPPKTPPTDAIQELSALESAYAAASAQVKPGADFEEAVFREPDKTLTVYLKTTPKASQASFGGDARAQVASTGLQVTQFQALHDTATTTLDIPAQKTQGPTLHEHVAGDLPTETDVATVIEHARLAPHLVLTPRFMFRIDDTGAITYIGPNQVPPAGASRTP